MDGGSYTIRWDDDPRGQGGGIISEEAMSTIESSHYSMDGHQSHLNSEVIIPDTDQIAAENLIFLAQDIVGQINSYGDNVSGYPGDGFSMEQVEIEQVTEEVITDDWVQPGGQERVEVPLEQLAIANVEHLTEGNDIDVPLPTDQDEYTAMRPFPCDFCPRRFRKKSNLMNHMVAHQNDRPYGCNLCGARYVRKCDLMNHLKVHAYVPDDGDEEALEEPQPKRRNRKRSGQYSISDKTSFVDKTAVAARTQQYEGSGSGNSNATTSLRIVYEITDPSRPFVCQHCGIGFAREKALASHSRVHGGDSPIECYTCGELCWSKENLISHTHSKHPHKSPKALPVYGGDDASTEESAVEEEEEDERWVDLVCKDCGVSFERADLLQRHARAAHSHMKKEAEEVDNSNSVDNLEKSSNENNENWEELTHTCSVCGDHFRDALELLAHAESHARSQQNRCMHCGAKFDDQNKVAEHIASSHPDMPPNSCPYCGRMCSDVKSLTKHVTTQHESPLKVLFCPNCGKNFHNKAKLKRHMESHRDKAVSCNICGENFADGRTLMNHRHSHKGSSGRRFPCQECGKSFGSRSSQQIHLRIHTGERPYGCRFCWKAFADGGTLRKHERIHTGEKPYACAICPRAFNQRVVLREHVRSHHSGPDAHHGTGVAPYWCSVCDRLMTTSIELVHHIIQHCDNNTALNRQPQIGPRKYKRRRKANDIKSSPNKEDSEQSASDGEKSYYFKKPIPIKKIQEENQVIPAEEEEAEPVQPEPFVRNESNNGGSARTKGKLKSKRTLNMPLRPKMIHTERAKPDADSNASRRSRGRNAVTLITSTTTTEERIRPRTKNVTYHDRVERLPAATFPSVKPEPEADIASDLRAILKEPECVDEFIIDSPSEGENVKCEPNDENSGNSFSIKEEGEDANNSVQYTMFRCEMCNESFVERDDLLTHVRVHI